MQLPRVVIAAVFFVIGALLAVPALINWVSPDSERAASATTTSPSPSGSSAIPVVTATFGAVSCPARTVTVTVRNTSDKTIDFAIEKDDDTAAIPGQIRPDSTRTVAIKLREDRRTRITVNWANKRIVARSFTANCKKSGGGAGTTPTPTPTRTPPEKLPHTGPDDVVWARAATGVGIILTGAIIFWYGGIWPRRREQVFSKKNT
ncbi:hypothetical protein E1264_23235 [Actinomadura sp. KC216]|uniref:hypothetical protein n=1 Tax=Actinomadura sp. KC216 TaxID=2530370 RepID=UPI0010488710|nr:hypothetical protein [Actinomadura sp. KC216]TDB84839.1 hypothetical protein E1264_23235 [Actinomadura sp. KC216]